MTTEIVGEVYDKVSIYPDNQQIGSILFSLKPQLIFKSEHSLLLLNLQLYGDLGGMTSEWDAESGVSIPVVDGLFGNSDNMGIALKADSFYRSDIGESDFFFKVGKYTTEHPFQFGAELVTGQFEVGYKLPVFSLIWSSVFFEWYKVNPLISTDQKVIQILAANLNYNNFNLKLTYPVLFTDNFGDFRQFPSIQLLYSKEFFTNDLFFGFSYRSTASGTNTGLIFTIREEASLTYGESWTTNLLYSCLSAGSEANDNYQFTSVDNQTPYLGYGTHFDYIYEEVGNIYGMHSASIRQQFKTEIFEIWAEAGSYFTYIPGTGLDSYVGTAVRGDIKLHEVWGEGTLLEILSSIFIPGGFSMITAGQTRNLGYQIILKLQHTY